MPGAHGTAPRAGSLGRRLLVGVRVGVIGGVALAIAGAVGRSVALVTLAAAIGPTAYVFAAHPATEISRLRNALLGHAVAIGAGLGSLAIFGLWTVPSIAQKAGTSWAQVGAASLSLAVTLVFLDVLDAHHAPAAATSLLISTGLARWGDPLAGLSLGLAVSILIGMTLGRLPVWRDAAVAEARRVRQQPDR